jgi:hypothetical protein
MTDSTVQRVIIILLQFRTYPVPLQYISALDVLVTWALCGFMIGGEIKSTNLDVCSSHVCGDPQSTNIGKTNALFGL